MMPRAGSLLSHVPPFILPDGRAGRADYNPLRRVAVLPILPGGPLFVLLHLYAPPQHVGIGHRYRTGAIGPFWRNRTGAMQDLGYELPRILYF